MLGHLKKALSYYWIVIKRAWSETISIFGWGWKSVVLLVLPAIVAFVFLVRFPDEKGFADYLVSGVYAVVVSAVVFAIVFSFYLLLAPSMLYSEIRNQLSEQMAQIRQRANRLEIADILKRCYEDGKAIKKSGGIVNFTGLEVRKAKRWHQENLRLFKDLLPGDEYYMYETLVEDPDPDDGPLPTLGFGLLNYHEVHGARLKKLRLIIARVLKE